MTKKTNAILEVVWTPTSLGDFSAKLQQIADGVEKEPRPDRDSDLALLGLWYCRKEIEDLHRLILLAERLGYCPPGMTWAVFEGEDCPHWCMTIADRLLEYIEEVVPQHAGPPPGSDAERVVWGLRTLARATWERVKRKKPNAKRRGAPIQHDYKGDKKVFEAWKTGNYPTYKACANLLGADYTAQSVELAIDRHRKRMKRMAVK